MISLLFLRFSQRLKLWICIAALSTSLWPARSACALDSSATPKPVPERLRWWKKARFGMFIHYGPVTLTGQEISWSRANSNPHCPNKGPIPVEIYDNLYKQFDPVHFRGSDWTSAAKSAGMKYIVLTTKHCDGFLLWDSKVDRYNIMATPFHRDIAAELALAARKDGLRLGWYFSPMDWRDPDFRTARNAAYLQRMRGELGEILSRYGNIDLLWFDYDGGEPVYDQASTYALVRRLRPEIIINNRLDLSTEPNESIRNPNADYYTPEQRIGAYDDQRPWETCMTLGTQWSWKPNDNIKSAAEVISILARVVGGDGNLLLDIGPMPDGRIEPRQLSVLQSVGAWMKRNSKSIYDTRGGPWKPSASLASTRKGKTIYVHVLTWPSGPLVLPDIPAEILSAATLDGSPVAFQRTSSGIEIRVQPAQRDAFDTVVALQVNKETLQIPAPDLVRANRASQRVGGTHCASPRDKCEPGAWLVPGRLERKTGAAEAGDEVGSRASE
jgi:alpha-L-fucosidase